MSKRRRTKRNTYWVLVTKGDYVFSFSTVKKIGNGSIKRGHLILDYFVATIDRRGSLKKRSGK